MIEGIDVRAGEMHYPRVPHEYWPSRLSMARAMGLTSVSTYVFWNAHEPRPGTYDFSGDLDVASFVRAAADAGLSVILRPGPYVCAEWDFGGLPAWLLAGGVTPVRTIDERYMAPVRAWLRRLGAELAPLQQSRGGPIVAVQLENEYGAFGSDAAYLRAMRDALRAAGFDAPLFTIDQPQDLERGSLPDVAVAATFAAGDPERDLGLLRAMRPHQRPACGEYWAGWFDHWGEPHAALDDAAQVRDLAYLASNADFNVYMFHGGTNFGFFNGANGSEERPYQPDVTSYDYQAALDEAGRPTHKFHAFRRILQNHDAPLPPIPRTMDLPPFFLDETAPLGDVLADPVELVRPKPMEALGQSFGFTLYRTVLPKAVHGVLDIGEARDFAVVMVEGRVAGTLDRRHAQHEIEIDAAVGARLDILVENCGRINYGPALPDGRKGILGAVTLDGAELNEWLAYRLPLDSLAPLRFDGGKRRAPVFLRGAFTCPDPADTFLDVRSLGKGVLFVNGRNAGRYWNEGPQASLYVPGVWLRPGRNVVVAFQTVEGTGNELRGSSDPIVV